MIGDGVRVTGDLVVQRSGARPVPIRFSGSSADLRLRVPSAAGATELAPGLSLGELGDLLGRWGMELTVETRGVRLVRLGGEGRRVRISLLGALYTLLTTAPWRIPSLVRSLRRTRPTRTRR